MSDGPRAFKTERLRFGADPDLNFDEIRGYVVLLWGKDGANIYWRNRNTGSGLAVRECCLGRFTNPKDAGLPPHFRSQELWAVGLTWDEAFGRLKERVNRQLGPLAVFQQSALLLGADGVAR